MATQIYKFDDDAIERISEYWLENPLTSIQGLVGHFRISNVNHLIRQMDKIRALKDLRAEVSRIRRYLCRDWYELVACGAIKVGKEDSLRAFVCKNFLMATDPDFKAKTEVSGPSGKSVQVEVVSHGAEKWANG
jgi:hypothetical protein